MSTLISVNNAIFIVNCNNLYSDLWSLISPLEIFQSAQHERWGKRFCISGLFLSQKYNKSQKIQRFSTKKKMSLKLSALRSQDAIVLMPKLVLVPPSSSCRSSSSNKSEGKRLQLTMILWADSVALKKWFTFMSIIVCCVEPITKQLRVCKV